MPVSLANKPKKTQKRANAAQELELNCTAISLSFNWFGLTRSLSSNQKAEAANVFDADSKSISANKKLINTKNPFYRELQSIRIGAYAYWRQFSLPYTDEGVRLFKNETLDTHLEQLGYFRQQLKDAETNLNNDYENILEDAKQRLGTLFNPADYPSTFLGQFKMYWDFRNLQPPDYLKTFRPDLYEEQKQRMAAKFEQAVILAEEAFLEEFNKLISHLTNKLSGAEDGKEKIFHETTITNVQEFFNRFKTLNLKSNSQLDKLVEDAQKLLKGVNAKQVRSNTDLRKNLAENLGHVEQQLSTMITVKPSRKLFVDEDSE